MEHHRHCGAGPVPGRPACRGGEPDGGGLGLICWDSADDVSTDIYCFSELPSPDTPVNPMGLLSAPLPSSDAFLGRFPVAGNHTEDASLPVLAPTCFA